jgi:hypothetical protein
MRPRPSPVTSAVAPVSTEAAVADRARSLRRLGLLLAATFLTFAPAAAQMRTTDDADPRDPLRRPSLRATTTRPATSRTATSSPLRGSLGIRRDAETTANEPPASAPARDPLLTAEPPVDADPTALEPIGRPASAARTPAPTDRPDARTAGPAAGRIDPATGRPMVLGGDATAGRRPVGPAERTGTVPKGGPTLAEPAVQPRPRDVLADKRDEATIESEDYAPLGLRTGGFTWLPAIETSTGWSSNVASKAGGASGMTWRVAPELIGRSDWSRHSLQIELRGAYLGNTADHDYDKPTFQGALRGRVDLGDETTVDVKAGWSHDRQTTTAADNPANTVVPATTETKTASLGITRDVGLVALTLRGDIERTDYSGGTTSTGASLGSEIQNNTRHIAALRATYGSKGSLRPFVEVQASNRDYDDAIVAGSPRDSVGAAAKVGVVADLGPVLRGEISTGWGVERPEKGALPDISGWLLDGSLVWSPTRLTSVKLDAKTSFEPTTLATSAGAVSRTVGVSVDHALRPDLVATAGVALTDKRYAGTSLREDTLTLSSGLTYKVDRNIQTFVKGGLTRYVSSSAGADYDVATVMVGVRLQR